MELRHSDTEWFIRGEARELVLLAHLLLSAAMTEEPDDAQMIQLGENTSIVATRSE